MKKEEDSLKSTLVTEGEHAFKFTSPDYKEKTLTLTITEPFILEEKLERTNSGLELVREIHTGLQPKSVEYTEDGKYLVTALLGDKKISVEVFDGKTFEKIKTIVLPKKYGELTGFVEIAFVGHTNEMWVSQMPANVVHVFAMDDFSLKKTIAVKGTSPKVILITADEKRAYVSNYTSHSVSVIDVDSKKLLFTFRTAKQPRGLAESPDGKYLYVAGYFNGVIQKFELPGCKLVKTLDFGYGSKRHLVLDKAKNILYASDMHTGSVYVVDCSDDSLVKRIPVDDKINTIKLSSDGKYLYASSRGPNAEKSYLIKGPRFGRAYAIDTASFSIVDWAWGRNQPTGLAVSPDDRYLAFTDFRDHMIEIYRIGWVK